MIGNVWEPSHHCSIMHRLVPKLRLPDTVPVKSSLPKGPDPAVTRDLETILAAIAAAPRRAPQWERCSPDWREKSRMY